MDEEEHVYDSYESRPLIGNARRSEDENRTIAMVITRKP